MNYKITHTTTYNYSAPVSVCHNLLILTPRESARLSCSSHRLVIRPTPATTVRRTDYFGNHIHAFAIEEQHQSLSVTSTSRVTVKSMEEQWSISGPPWEQVRDRVRAKEDPNWLDCALYSFDSPRVTTALNYEAYAVQNFPIGTPILTGARDLTARIHADFVYDTTATTVSTRTDDVFERRRGVCQDFAHVQIACLRSLGLPCRYVSGYLRTLPPPGQTKLVGADQSHAWVAVYCGEEIGWVEVDPTNNGTCGLDHIPIAWGRDYSDVVPFRGAYTGGGKHTLSVSVDVREHRRAVG